MQVNKVPWSTRLPTFSGILSITPENGEQMYVYDKWMEASCSADLASAICACADFTFESARSYSVEEMIFLSTSIFTLFSSTNADLSCAMASAKAAFAFDNSV